MRSLWRGRIGVALGALLLVGTAQVIVQVMSQAPAAAAVANLSRHESAPDPIDDEPSRFVVAFCPEGKQIVGGGAVIDDFGANRVLLTRVQPIKNGGPQGYVAEASAMPGFAGFWRLHAYAICGTGLSGHTIVSGPLVSAGSNPFVATLAACPVGQFATGTGTYVEGSLGHVGIQLNRPSGPRDISRSTAIELDTFNGDWKVRSFAICATGTLGLAVEGEVDTVDGSDSYTCSGTKRVHNVSGGGTLNGSTGPVFLKALFPHPDLRSVTVTMTSPPGTPVPDGIVIQAMCG